MLSLGVEMWVGNPPQGGCHRRMKPGYLDAAIKTELGYWAGLSKKENEAMQEYDCKGYGAGCTQTMCSFIMQNILLR